MSKDARGFTLIEMLVATAFLAVALLSVASMFLTAYNNVGWGREQTTGVMLASQRMEYLRTQPNTSADLNAGTVTTTYASPYAGFTRTTTIVDNMPAAGLKQVTIQIAMPSGRTARIVSLIRS
jgi:prepilin-type N-terminal cleavage/methylation domain-containing protein